MENNQNWINVTTLGDMIDMRAHRHPDKEAIIFSDQLYTYKYLADYSKHICKSLLALGVEPGDRVDYFLEECVETIAIILASAKIGAVVAPINSRFKSTELRQVIVHAGMKVIFTSTPKSGTDFNQLIQETFPQISESKETDLNFEEAPELDSVVIFDELNRPGTINITQLNELASGIDDDQVRSRQSSVRVRDTAIIMYTSGTVSYTHLTLPTNREV